MQTSSARYVCCRVAATLVTNPSALALNLMRTQMGKAYDNKIKSLKGKLSQLGNGRPCDSIYRFILEKYHCPELATAFDTAENMIPIKPGKVINLQTGKLEDRTDKHYFTFEYNFKYLGKDRKLTPLTNDFFMKVACNNKIKADFLRLIMGSSITTDTKMKCFFIFTGSGDNAKSTLLAIHGKTFSRKYEALDPNMLFAESKDKVDAISYGKLLGKTIATCVEPEHKYCNNEVLKLLTGGDGVEGKKLYQDTFTFTPQAKIFVALNNLICIKDDKHGVMKKRTRIINFNAKFCDNPKKPNEFKGDANIETKFTTNEEYMNDYFTFIVNAAIEYLSHGDNRNLALKQPKELQFEVDDYFKKCDKYHSFIEDHLVQDPNGRISKTAITRLYQEYLFNNGFVEDNNTKRNLFNYLSDKGFSTIKSNGSYKYIGLREKTEQEIKDEDTKPEEIEKIKAGLIFEVEKPVNSENNSCLLDEVKKLKEENEYLKKELENIHKFLKMQMTNKNNKVDEENEEDTLSKPEKKKSKKPEKKKKSKHIDIDDEHSENVSNNLKSFFNL